MVTTPDSPSRETEIGVIPSLFMVCKTLLCIPKHLERDFTSSAQMEGSLKVYCENFTSAVFVFQFFVCVDLVIGITNKPPTFHATRKGARSVFGGR